MTGATQHGPLPAPPGSILLVCIRLIGDVILSTPLIGLLKAAFPESAIDVLVNRGTGEFLEKDPRVRRVLYARNREFGGARPCTGEGYALRIFRNYDLAISMNASDRGTIAAILAGRKARVAFFRDDGFLRSAWKKVLLTHRVEFPFAIHVARLCQLMAEALGVPVPRLEARVFWDGADEAAVDGFLSRERVNGPFFVVHPFARWRYKYWVADRFAAVSDSVAERYGLAPVWSSSPQPEEIALLREAAALCARPPVLSAGEFTLNGMTCLLSRASLYLGLDTAVTHLAATTGVPMVVLYGPTISERWSPWKNDGPVAEQFPRSRGTQRLGRTILLQKDWECVSCGKAGCDDRGGESLCLREIGTDQVLSAVDEVLADRDGDEGAT
jgi:heptosyltransferase-3